MGENCEELKELSDEARQVITEIQKARNRSRQAKWLSLAALAISVIRFIIELVSVSQY